MARQGPPALTFGQVEYWGWGALDWFDQERVAEHLFGWGRIRHPVPPDLNPTGFQFAVGGSPRRFIAMREGPHAAADDAFDWDEWMFEHGETWED